MECIIIKETERTNEYKNQIQHYERNKQNYRIEINFYDNSSIEYKMQVMEMIHQMNADKKVGRMWIRLNRKVGWIKNIFVKNNPVDEKVLKTMINRYTNLYNVVIDDWNDQVDSKLHNLVK